MSGLQSERAQGGVLLATLILLCAAMLAPSLAEIRESFERIELAEMRIATHRAKLVEPVRSAQPLEFESFLVPAERIEETSQAALQTALVEVVRSNGARLIDLRPNAADQEIDGLTALGFRMEFESDFRAALQTINMLGTANCPFLLDRVQLRPVGQFERPDRRVRVLLSVSCWTELAE